jgi:hypothetical protein
LALIFIELVKKFVHDSDEGYDLYFYAPAFGQCADSDSGACRIGGGKVFGVHGVHVGKIIHRSKEDGRFYDMIQGELGFIQQGLDVFEYLFGLFCYAARHKVACGGVDAQLPGQEKEAIGLNGLRIRPDSGRGIEGRKRLFHDLFLIILVYAKVAIIFLLFLIFDGKM